MFNQYRKRTYKDLPESKKWQVNGNQAYIGDPFIQLFKLPKVPADFKTKYVPKQ
jgi:hypothetical protein